MSTPPVRRLEFDPKMFEAEALFDVLTQIQGDSGIDLVLEPASTLNGRHRVRRTDASVAIPEVVVRKIQTAIDKIRKRTDVVNNPTHYTTGKIEVWDFIVDQGLNYLTGNVIKYICRAGRKDPQKHLEDLNKAKAYLEREIKRISDNATDF